MTRGADYRASSLFPPLPFPRPLSLPAPWIHTPSWASSLTPIITKQTIALSALHGRTLAVNGNAELYQFLALIRLQQYV